LNCPVRAAPLSEREAENDFDYLGKLIEELVEHGGPKFSQFWLRQKLHRDHMPANTHTKYLIASPPYMLRGAFDMMQRGSFIRGGL